MLLQILKLFYIKGSPVALPKFKVSPGDTLTDMLGFNPEASPLNEWCKLPHKKNKKTHCMYIVIYYGGGFCVAGQDTSSILAA